MTEPNIEQEYKNYEDENENTTPALVKNQTASGKGLCSGCPNEWGDKFHCTEFCLRLKAYQYNKPFEHLPYYANQLNTPQIVDALQETPKTTEPITPKTTSWKRAMPKKPKKKKEKKLMSEDPVKYEINLKSTDKAADEALGDVISHTLLLDFTKYQEIYRELKAQAELTKLPISHVLMSVLSMGIVAAHADEKGRQKI